MESYKSKFVMTQNLVSWSNTITKTDKHNHFSIGMALSKPPVFTIAVNVINATAT